MPDSAYFYDRLARLYGKDGLKKLESSVVMIVGLGGVGSWAAEAVVRCAVGKVILVDFDEVCETNINRQLQATSETLHKYKTEALAERFKKINPNISVISINSHLTQENCAQIMEHKPDFVIDAIDNITAKCFLINYCKKNNTPMIVSCGSGGRSNPEKIKITDLGLTENDALARNVRRILREKYAFPAKGKFGIKAVCSSENFIKPQEGLKPNETKNSISLGEGNNKKHPPLILGTACFITGIFGFMCASQAVNALLNKGE